MTSPPLAPKSTGGHAGRLHGILLQGDNASHWATPPSGAAILGDPCPWPAPRFYSMYMAGKGPKGSIRLLLVERPWALMTGCSRESSSQMWDANGELLGEAPKMVVSPDCRFVNANSRRSSFHRLLVVSSTTGS